MSDRVHRPRLIIASKDALKDLDAAEMRDRTLERYDVMLPGEMGQQIKSPQIMWNEHHARIAMNLGNGMDLNTEQSQMVEMVARTLNGDFGPDARIIGVPSWLEHDVQNYLLTLPDGQQPRQKVNHWTTDFIFDSDGLGAKKGGKEQVQIESRVKTAQLEDQRQGRMAKAKKKILGGVEDGWKSARGKLSKSKGVEMP